MSTRHAALVRQLREFVASAILVLPLLPSASRAAPIPFHSQVAVSFCLARESHVAVVVVDAAGRAIAELHSGDLSAGSHTVSWDGTTRSGDVARAGTHWYRVVAGAESAAGRLERLR